MGGAYRMRACLEDMQRVSEERVIAGDCNRDRERTLFLNDEILLDNQASQCIIHNETGRDPYNMCGID